MTPVDQADYYWGIPTSTIDWCEDNYTVSPYLAEFANTTSNLAFVALALFGVYNTIKNNFSFSFVLAHLAVAFVGFGSWCFHMTLKYEMQLLDELPMIYAGCVMVWHIFEVYPKNQYGIGLPLGLVGYSAFVTYSYLIINNPVYHQVCYGLLVFTVVIRSVYVLRLIPGPYTKDEKPQLERLLKLAAACFAGAFFVWNIDNIFCNALHGLREALGMPLGMLSELHAWWHIGTGFGVYYFVVYTEWIHQVVKCKKQRFYLRWVGPLVYLKPMYDQSVKSRK